MVHGPGHTIIGMRMKHPVGLPRYYKHKSRKRLSNKTREAVYAKLRSNGNVCALCGQPIWQMIKFISTALYLYTKGEQTTHLTYKLFMLFVTLPKGSTDLNDSSIQWHCCVSRRLLPLTARRVSFRLAWLRLQEYLPDLVVLA